MTELHILQRALTEHEARSLTDEVKRDGEVLWTKLRILHDGQAAEALGYSSWHSYCEAEFGFKQAQAYRLLHAGQVNAVIPWDNKPTNERQARELAPLLDHPDELRDAWTDALSVNANPTAAQVRDAVSRRMDVHYSSATDLWSTPQDLYNQLHTEFGFTLDVCATVENAKCEAHFTEADDGLARTWRGVCWMNPPYGDAIPNWIAKAHASADEGATVVCLVPARVDTSWWWDHCRHAEIRFLRGRLKFGGRQNSAPFPSAVVIFGRPANVIWWER